MSKEVFSENVLIEQSAKGLFGELGWETANCHHGFEMAGRSSLGCDLAENDRRLYPCPGRLPRVVRRTSINV